MKTTREVVEAFFDAFNRHDVAALVALYAEDAVNHQMPTKPLRGRDAIQESFEVGFAAIPDMGCRVIKSSSTVSGARPSGRVGGRTVRPVVPRGHTG